MFNLHVPSERVTIIRLTLNKVVVVDDKPTTNAPPCYETFSDHVVKNFINIEVTTVINGTPMKAMTANLPRQLSFNALSATI